MNEIENMAVEIYKGRKEILEKIKKEKEEKQKLYEARINHAARMLLAIFEASNKEETEAQVWQVKISICEDNEQLMECSVAFSNDDCAIFYGSEDNRIIDKFDKEKNIKFKFLESAIEIVDKMNILKEEIKDIYDCLQNTPEYFHIFRREGSLTILMDTPTI